MKTFSIIIPVFNAEKTLDDCLRQVDGLAFPKSHVEVIIVDGGSTDRSLSIAKKWDVTVLKKHFLRPAAARNAGAHTAHNDNLVFIDADYRVPAELLGQAIEKLLFYDIYGTWIAASKDQNWIAKTWLSANIPDTGAQHALSAGVLIVSKEHFNLVGGFNTEYRADTYREFCLHALALDLHLYHDASMASVDLGQPEDLRSFFEREMRHAASGMQLFRDYGVGESAETVALYVGVFLSCLALAIGILGFKLVVLFWIIAAWVVTALLWSAFHLKPTEKGSGSTRRDDRFFNLVILSAVSLLAKSAALFRYHQLDDLLRKAKS